MMKQLLSTTNSSAILSSHWQNPEKKNIYEYRLVLHNNSLTVIRPKTEIILFNDIGIQIGMAQIEQTDATTELEGPTALDPGEVRSYTAAINLIRDEKPSYFLLNISETNHTATDKLRKQLDGIIIIDWNSYLREH